MQLRRFQAANMTEAYAQVRDALGDDAMIVSTRSAAGGSPDPGRARSVEVVAGVPDDGAEPMTEVTLDQDAAAHELVRGIAEAVATDGEQAFESLQRGEEAGEEREFALPFVNAIAGTTDTAHAAGGPFDIFDRRGEAGSTDAAGDGAVAAEEPQPAARAGEADSDLLRKMAAQLVELRGMVERISLERSNERIDEGPVTLREARDRLIDQGVGRSVLIPLLDQVAESIVPDPTPQTVLQVVERKLAAALPAVPILDLGRSPLAIFIVGAGGSGKTSVAVRLGLELVSVRGARVTLASIDVNRAGAPQQLNACAAASGLPVRLCYSPGELKALLAEGSADVVVIDTPGHNGARRDRMAEMNAFTQVTRHRATLLTLPAIGKSDDLLRTTVALAAAGVDGLVLTRCDETETFGGLLTAACVSGVGIAYTTHGEGISEGLRRGDNHALAVALLGRRWPDPVSAGAARTG